MKAVLIYPPANSRNSEAFPLPNLAIAALAGALDRAGHTCAQADLDLAWHRGLKRSFTPRELEALRSRERASAHARGKKKDPVFQKAARLLAAGLPRGDLYGITLVDMNSDPLMLNLSAALAALLREERGRPVVIGSRALPRQAYAQILREYPVFDYAVYTQDGEKALLDILARVGGGAVRPQGALQLAGGRILIHRSVPVLMPPPQPLYQDDILGAYTLDDRRLLASYDAAYPFVASLFKDNQSSLVVPYTFETTCPGACAFCSNNNGFPSNAKPPAQVVEELARLKARGVTGIYFINSAFNNSYKYASELCGLMIKARLDLPWSDCANVREIDEELLRKMRRAGAVKLAFGMETASPRLLRYIRKGATAERVSRCLKASHRLGIWNHIELIGGLPTETEADTLATCDFIRRHARVIDTYSLNPFFLNRGSPFYRSPAEFGLRLRPSGGAWDYLDTDERVGDFSERFDEEGGPAWERKTLQIRASTAALAAAIEEAAGVKWIDFEHIWLLMALYRRLGHSRKKAIKEHADLFTSRFRPFSGDAFVETCRYRKHEYRRELAPRAGAGKGRDGL